MFDLPTRYLFDNTANGWRAVRSVASHQDDAASPSPRLHTLARLVPVLGLVAQRAGPEELPEV
jgi:hypothetical protein